MPIAVEDNTYTAQTTPPSQAHIPVLLREAVAALEVRPGGKYVDATLGGAGHARAILEQASPGGTLLGVDADPAALEVARSVLRPFGDAALLVQANFVHLELVCRSYQFYPVDGILFDLGMSSMQLASARGFSFTENSPLDMRYDPSQELTAAHIVNGYPNGELARILERYGEERHARRIARRIVENRPIATARELAQVMEMAAGGRGRLHPATRTFMALRIAVNNELENLAEALRLTPSLLRPGGRLVVIAYHSLEDRLVKEFISRESRTCLCPPRTPVCLCHHQPTLRPVYRRVITPSPQEVRANARSRSARMRVAERL